MPVPFLLGLGAVIAGAAGVGGHINAKETNEQAQRVSDDAQRLYNNAKASLATAQNKTEQSLLSLGYRKKNVLETSMKQFLKSFQKVKKVNFIETEGLKEISRFVIDNQGALEIQRMTDIYENSFKSGAAGAAAGTVIALAASGSLPIVTGALTTAGTAIMAGEFSAAAGLAGSALAFGASMTPLVAIASPVVLFTGISASIKADENLEKARVMYSKAESAAEQMKTSETLCYAISKRSEMFDELLLNLNSMFAECSGIMEGMIRKKEGSIIKKKLSSEDFTDDEIKLIAVTRALAGAVKAVIDTPILSKDGEISNESQTVYDTVNSELPKLKIEVNDAKLHNRNVKAIPVLSNTKNRREFKSQGISMPEKTRNVLAFLIGVVLSFFFAGPIADSLTDPNDKVWFLNALWLNKISLCMVFCASTTMIIGKYLSVFSNRTCRIANFLGLSILYVQFCRTVINMNHYIIFSAVMIFVIIFIIGAAFEKKWNGAAFVTWQSFSIGCAPCGFLIYAFCTRLLGFSENPILIVTTLLYSLFVGSAMYMDDLN